MVNIKSYVKLAIDTLNKNKRICFPLLNNTEFKKIVEGVMETVQNIEIDDQKQCIKLVEIKQNEPTPPTPQATSPTPQVQTVSTNDNKEETQKVTLASKGHSVRATIRISESLAVKLQEIYKTDSVTMAVKLALIEALKQHNVDISSISTQRKQKPTIPDIDEIFK